MATIGPIINTTEISAVTANAMDMTHVSGSMYAILQQYSTFTLRLDTVNVDSSGSISLLDSNNTSGYLAGSGLTHSFQVFLMGERIVGVAYANGGGAKGVEFESYSIDSAGNINSTPIDTLSITSVAFKYVHVRNVSGPIWALAAVDDEVTPTIYTFTGNSDGTFGASEIASEVLPASVSSCRLTDFQAIQDDIWAIAYRDYPGYSGSGTLEVRTFEIDSNTGAISPTIDTLSTVGVNYNALEGPALMVADNDWCFVAWNHSTDGKTQSFQIDSNGIISNRQAPVSFWGTNATSRYQSPLNLGGGYFITPHTKGGGSTWDLELFYIDTEVGAVTSLDTVQVANNPRYQARVLQNALTPELVVFSYPISGYTYVSSFNVGIPVQTLTTMLSDAIIGKYVNPAIFTFAGPATVAGTGPSKNSTSFDIKLKHKCSHKLSTGTFRLAQCPRCLGTGYYYDAKFNDVGKLMKITLEDKLIQTLEKLALTEENKFHPEIAIGVTKWLGALGNSGNLGVIKDEIVSSLASLQEIQKTVKNLSPRARIASINNISADLTTLDTLVYSVTLVTVSGEEKTVSGSISLSDLSN